MKAEDIEGYRGKEDIDAILSFIEAEVIPFAYVECQIRLVFNIWPFGSSWICVWPINFQKGGKKKKSSEKADKTIGKKKPEKEEKENNKVRKKKEKSVEKENNSCNSNSNSIATKSNVGKKLSVDNSSEAEVLEEVEEEEEEEEAPTTNILEKV